MVEREMGENEAATDSPSMAERSASPNAALSAADDLFVEMFEAGVHFGQKKSILHPRMRPFVFAIRNGIAFIDLEKTKEYLERAEAFLEELVAGGGKVLLVGTKPQARSAITRLAEKSGMPFVSLRWLGGTLTNFPTIRKRLDYLEDLEGKRSSGEFEKYTKWEQQQFTEEIERLEEKMGGLKTLKSLPSALLVVDLAHDAVAVREAKHVGIPIVALADTNVDPSLANYPIPANDDAATAIHWILERLGKAVERGLQKAKERELAQTEVAIPEAGSSPNMV